MAPSAKNLRLAKHGCCLGLLLFFSLSDVTALVAPRTLSSPRSRSTSLNARTPLISGLTLKTLKQDANRLIKHAIPPIPLQEEEDVGIRKQFQPRFIAREFLLGARIMCLIFPFLLMGSWVGHVLRFLVISNSSFLWLPAMNGVSGFAKLQSLIKRTGINYLNFRAGSVATDVFLGPIAEEIAFRGVAHWFGALCARLSLGVFVFFCRFRFLSPWLLLLGEVEMLTLVTKFLDNVPLKKSLDPALWKSQIVRTAAFLILLPTKSKIASTLGGIIEGKKQTEPKEGNLLETTEDSVSKVVSNTNNSKKKRVGLLNHNHFISRMVSRRSGLSSDHIKPAADLAVSRTARFYGALHFGIAHMATVGFLKRVEWNPVQEIFLRSRYLQKAIGTTISSLLIESRLAVNRRTLWGAIGAHIMFNAIGYVLPPLPVSHGKWFWFSWVGVRIPYILVCTKLVWWFAAKLQALENKIA